MVHLQNNLKYFGSENCSKLLTPCPVKTRPRSHWLDFTTRNVAQSASTSLRCAGSQCCAHVASRVAQRTGNIFRTPGHCRIVEQIGADPVCWIAEVWMGLPTT